MYQSKQRWFNVNRPVIQVKKTIIIIKYYYCQRQEIENNISVPKEGNTYLKTIETHYKY